MSSEQNQQPSMSPLLCANGCGFYGNPTTRNLCSKCHREQLKRDQLEASAPVHEASRSPAYPGALRETVPLQKQFPSMPIAVATTEYSQVPNKDSGSQATSTGDALEPRAEDSKTPDSPGSTVASQTNTSRCWRCNKKVGLLGFQCRCGYFFCGDHRYADAHDCSFDYKTFGREQLSKANQKVVAEKLNKI